MGTNKYCIKCGYNLPSDRFTRCPECGASLRKKEAGENIRKTTREKRQKQKAIKTKRLSVLLWPFFVAMFLSVAFLVYGLCVGMNISVLFPFTLLLAILGFFICLFLNYFMVIFLDFIKKVRDLRSQVGLKRMIVIIATIIVVLGVFIAPRLLAQKDVDYTASICSEHGIASSECSAAQNKKNVSCNQQGLYVECRKDYFVVFPFFYR